MKRKDSTNILERVSSKELTKMCGILVSVLYDLNLINYKELQVKIFERGKQIYNVRDVFERQKYCTEEMKTLYPEIKRLENPHVYYVDLSKKLLNLKKKLIEEHTKGE